MKKIISIYFFLALAFQVSACTTSLEGVEYSFTSTPSRQPELILTSTSIPIPAIGDGGLITGDPCGPPCFWKIVPGKTSKIDAYQILVKKGLIVDCIVIDQYQSAIKQGIGGWGCKGLEITFKQDTEIVNIIRFEPTLPLLLQDIIEKHGPPDFVEILDSGLPESPSIMVSVYFSALRIDLPIGEYEGSQYEIKPTEIINVVSYYGDDSFSGDSTSFKMAIPWKGYGNYP